MSQQVLESVLSILVYIGVPVIPLLILAVQIGRWHNANPDPPLVTQESEHRA
jgi:hypothetical protein